MAFTYFFRDLQTLELLRDHALPSLDGRRHIDIWDAGCAMGPEAYTLAILLRERMGRFMFRNVRIFASDIDGSNRFGTIIEQGIYSNDETRRIPGGLREKYFTTLDADRYQLRDDIRSCVTYQRHDLLTRESIRSNMGLVVCKNVLLHFQEEMRIAVIKMFHNALGETGFFATEQTQALPSPVSHLFEPVVLNARIYRKLPG